MIFWSRRYFNLNIILKAAFQIAALLLIMHLILIFRWRIKDPEVIQLQHSLSISEPTLEVSDIYSEKLKIKADDRRLIRYILNYHLTAPPISGEVDEFPDLLVTDVYQQQEVSRYVINHFKRKKNGFYIECGASDGVFYSNTIMLETMYNWNGLLIEADPRPYNRLRTRNRKAWLSNTCLSTTLYPSKVKMMRNEKAEGLSYLPGYRHIIGNEVDYTEFEAKCFPLYSILLAINVTEVDYFSLDIEGTELDVLKTIPWNKVTIKMLSIEVHPEYVNPVRQYMTSVGYKYLTFIKNGYSHDQIYALE